MTTSSLSMDMTIAKIGVDYLKTTVLGGGKGFFSGFRFGSSNALTLDELTINVAGDPTYFGVAGEMSYIRLNKYEVILKAVIDHDKGDFDIGSFAITVGPSNIPFFIGTFPYIHKKMATRDTKLGGRFTLQIKFKMYDLDEYWTFSNLAASYAKADNTQINYQDIPDTYVESPGYMVQIDQPKHESGRKGYLLYQGRKGLSWRAQDLHMKHTDPYFWKIDGGVDGDGHQISNDGWYAGPLYQAQDIADSVVKYPCAISDFRQKMYAITPVAYANLLSSPAAGLQALPSVFGTVYEFSRPSNTATYVDAGGVLKVAESNVPRWDHTNGHPQLLIEGPAINYVASSEMYGFAPGVLNHTGGGNTGVLPSGWSVNFGGSSTGTFTLVSVVKDSKGRRRLRIQAAISNASGMNQSPRVIIGSTNSSNGIVLSSQCFVNVISTSHTLSLITEATSPNTTLTNTTLSVGENVVKHNGMTFPNGGQTSTRMLVQATISNGQTWTATFEIAIPQIEINNRCSSYIPTSIGPVAREADSLRFSSKVRQLMQRNAVTVVVKGQHIWGTNGNLIGGSSQRLVGINNTDNGIVFGHSTTYQVSAVTSPIPSFGLSAAWNASGKAASYNGGAVQSNPTALDTVRTDSYVGRGSAFAYGWYDSIVVYPYRLANSALIAKSPAYVD